ncbi:hypothetical protein EYZ11_010033 [Aspergillus tanneri]|uniref:Vacuolar calcium ion transporter n=1 Tax=Aspergillus tanneri TaxID=1220188 RepID=A0A4S3J8I2_9EURO|nr:uncharacterized protein ATNIH1004_003710 [Aspergillus tanneri]KAA8651019.1 hypothetical protein ATNIH1004_003710 [Aspergillus tanneri]THC90507.1 hypothetical protein EYZ11_010033 [Aspergillus tanneri]
MRSTRSPSQLAESAPFPDEVDDARPSVSPAAKQNLQAVDLNSAWAAVRTTLFSSYTNLLLPTVFLGILAGAQKWNDSAVFILNFLAILPLASLLSFSTEELAKSVGETVGGLINATFGNALEMIVGATAVNKGELHIVQSSMIGSVLSGNILILGSCFLFGGYNTETVTFSVDVSQIMSSLMIVTSSSLIIPSALYSTTVSRSDEVETGVLDLSRGAATILLVFYLVFLYFQLKSHADLFVTGDDGDDEVSEVQLGPWSATLVLILATLGVTVCSDSLVDSVDGIVEAWGISRAFIGLIIVPIVGNAGEFSTTVNAAMKGKMGLAIGVIVGSTLQIALFVTPFMVIWGWIIGRPMSLHFNTFEIAVFSLAVVMTNCLMRKGQSNYYEGFLLMGMYLILAIAFYVHPDQSVIS